MTIIVGMRRFFLTAQCAKRKRSNPKSYTIFFSLTDPGLSAYCYNKLINLFQQNRRMEEKNQQLTRSSGRAD